MATDRLSECYASWNNGRLVVGNSEFEESWTQTDGGFLKPLELSRKKGGGWGGITGDDVPVNDAWSVQYACEHTRPTVCSAEALMVTVRMEERSDPERWRSFVFLVFPGLTGSILEVQDLTTRANDGLDKELSMRVQEADGVERESNGQLMITLPEGSLPGWDLAQRHLCLREFQYVDQTDHHADFAYEREWQLHPSERVLPLRANVVALESLSSDNSGEGVLWVMLAPLHHVRKAWSAPYDFLLTHEESGWTFRYWPVGYAVARLSYAGGRTGSLLAMQQLQRTLQASGHGSAGSVMSNTWGDRAGARHLSEAFLQEEIAAAKTIGVEVLQIDDGWQKGDTVNTVQDRSQGVWNGFWAADPHFWDVHPVRFPHGLGVIADRVREAGLELGLWFAPDSSQEFANWGKDAAVLLGLWRELGVRHFKLDAVKLTSRLAEVRFHQLCEHVLAASEGEIVFDYDATAERRPTYWGRIGGGQLFLENRYTDFGNYYPHQTLRALWSLTAHGILPSRLRLEFLNSARNLDCYAEDDPLRPDAWPVDYQLAITLVASPLAWMEVSRVPKGRQQVWAGLLKAWKPHREAFHRGAVLPVGGQPNGYNWSGFLSLDRQEETDVLYAVIFRELHPKDVWSFRVPEGYGCDICESSEAEVIAGQGSVSNVVDNEFTVRMANVRAYVVVRWALS